MTIDNHCQFGGCLDFSTLLEAVVGIRGVAWFARPKLPGRQRGIRFGDLAPSIREPGANRAKQESDQRLRLCPEVCAWVRLGEVS